MFAYDSANDEYGKEKIPSGSTSIVISSRRSSLRSSKSSSIRSSSRNLLSRLISKNGRLNTHLSKVPNKKLNYFLDLGNTLLNIRWRWILITLFSVNFLTFSIFTVLWMWMAKVSGDFDKNQKDLCVVNAKSFAGYFLLTIETLMTIGYGHRYPTEKCWNGWILQTVQALVGVIIQGVLISAVYVKISKPFTRNARSLFGEKAVICLRDGKLCLLVRIIDQTGKVSIGTNITMYFLDKDSHPFCMEQIKIERHGLLIFPSEILHVIDSQSPLWNLSPAQFLIKRFEIIVVVEGISMVTAQMSQNRTSYTNGDILWGHRFAPCIEFHCDKMRYFIIDSNVNNTFPIDTPLCSAQELQTLASSLMEKLPD